MCVRVRACVNAKPIVKYNTGGYCVCVCDDSNLQLLPCTHFITRPQLTASDRLHLQIGYRSATRVGTVSFLRPSLPLRPLRVVVGLLKRVVGATARTS